MHPCAHAGFAPPLQPECGRHPPPSDPSFCKIMHPCAHAGFAPPVQSECGDHPPSSGPCCLCCAHEGRASVDMGRWGAGIFQSRMFKTGYLQDTLRCRVSCPSCLCCALEGLAEAHVARWGPGSCLCCALEGRAEAHMGRWGPGSSALMSTFVPPTLNVHHELHCPQLKKGLSIVMEKLVPCANITNVPAPLSMMPADASVQSTFCTQHVGEAGVAVCGHGWASWGAALVKTGTPKPIAMWPINHALTGP